jgi:ribosomal protein S6--L-glutamate ligase
VACQTAEDAMTAFERLGGDVVVKPLFGSEGRGIARLSDPDLALRAFKMLAQLGGVIYLQEFIEHEGCDLRLFVLGQQVFAMRRKSASDWRTNVSRGADTEPFSPGDDLIDLARRAASAVGAPLAGVDLLPARDGKLYVLEVNAVPGWQALSRTLKVDIAAAVLDYVAELAQAFKNRRVAGSGA